MKTLTSNYYTFKTIGNAKKLTGFGYLGNVNSSSKIAKGQKIGIDTYVMYLAPSDLSGFNTCPKASKECREACIFTTGRVKMDIRNTIVNSRIRKTKLFFEHREFFNAWLFAEISVAKAKAEAKGHEFAVRLNGTSDISLALFTHNDQNVLDAFPDVQFYDYTKVSNRKKFVEVYDNYHLTFSFTGRNFYESMDMLEAGINVAVVFRGKLPSEYLGYKVVDGDITDYRPNDEKGVIVGLKYKRTKKFQGLSDQQKENYFKGNPFIV